jgi:hypothetical protein
MKRCLSRMEIQWVLFITFLRERRQRCFIYYSPHLIDYIYRPTAV